jgi:hypothetical protein
VDVDRGAEARRAELLEDAELMGVRERGHPHAGVLGDETRLVTADQSVVIPAGMRHGFRNVGTSILKAMTSSTSSTAWMWTGAPRPGAQNCSKMQS